MQPFIFQRISESLPKERMTTLASNWLTNLRPKTVQVFAPGHPTLSRVWPTLRQGLAPLGANGATPSSQVGVTNQQLWTNLNWTLQFHAAIKEGIIDGEWDLLPGTGFFLCFLYFLFFVKLWCFLFLRNFDVHFLHKIFTIILGNPSWGIAWFINDQLIPEIYVERGQTYHFWVEGGVYRKLKISP